MTDPIIRKPEATKKVAFRLEMTAEEKAKLEKLAEFYGVTQAEAVRQLIDFGYDKAATVSA